MESPWPCYPVAPPPRGEDLPYSDGVPMESEQHVRQMHLLADTLEAAWRERNDFYVGRNMFLYYSELQSKKNDFRGPDVFVVLNTERKVRKSWVVWEEGGRMPDVVIELTSPSTEAVDRGDKMRIYAQVLRVGEYFLFDPIEGWLEGYGLTGGLRAYQRMEPDERGWLRSQALGLWLGKVKTTVSGVEAEWLRWIDDDGNVLPTGEESAEAAAQRAGTEAQRADDAERRLRGAVEALRASGLSAEQVAALLGTGGPGER